MSTQPPVTPDQAIQQAIESAKQPDSFPLEVKLETGQVYRGQTPQEVLDQLVKAQTEASRTIKAQRDEMETLRSEVQSVRQRVEAPQAPPTADAAQEYLLKWAQNPEAATKEKVAEAFGVTPEALPRLAQEMQQQIAGRKIEQAADEFSRRCPEFPQTPESSQMMRQALIERYGTNNLGFVSQDPDKLEATYHELVRQNRIQPNYMPPSGYSQAPAMMPNLRGNSAPNTGVDFEYQFRQLPLEKQKQVLDDLAARGILR